MQCIPLELSDYIIDYLHDDATALAACSLTCRAWVPASHFHLFRTVVLQDPKYSARFQRLVQTSPDLGWYVRELTVAKFVSVGDVALSASPRAQEQETIVIEKVLPQLFAHVPALRALHLAHVDMKSFHDVGQLKHDAVTELNLSYCQFTDFADISDLVGCFPNLIELSMAGLTWKQEVRAPSPTPIPTLRNLKLGREMCSEKLFDWIDGASFYTSINAFAARCASERDADLIGAFLTLAGGSLRDLDLDWSVTGDKTIILPETVSLGECASLERLSLRFPVHYSAHLPWVTSLLATLDAGSIRTISCDVRLLGNVDALDWDGLSKLLSSEAYRNLEAVKFEVNLWPGVHKDFEEVEGLLRARLAPLDKKGMVHVSKA